MPLPGEVFVRKSTPADNPSIDNHLAASRIESSRYRGSIVESGPFDTFIAFVAGVGDTVFGSIRAGTNDGASWTIVHVYVEPDAREIGLGDAMVLRLLSDLSARGAQWVSAQAQPGDRAMKNLFERHGLVARTILVGKSLSDPSTGERASR